MFLDENDLRHVEISIRISIFLKKDISYQNGTMKIFAPNFVETNIFH